MADDFSQNVASELLAQQKTTNQRYADVVIGMNQFILAIAKQLEDAQDAHDKMDVKITAVKDKITYIIIVVSVVVSVFGTVGLGTYTWINANMDKRIKEQTATLINTRGPMNQLGVRPYIVDEKGQKQYIHMDTIPHTEAISQDTK